MGQAGRLSREGASMGQFGLARIPPGEEGFIGVGVAEKRRGEEGAKRDVITDTFSRPVSEWRQPRRYAGKDQP